MNSLLHSQIIEHGAQKRFYLDAVSEAALGGVVSFYGMTAGEFLRELERTFRDRGWPWAVVLLPRELPLAAHFMEARGVHRNLPMMSYSFLREAKNHRQGIPPAGVLLFPKRGVARRLAGVSPVIRAWWPVLQNLPTGTTHLIMVDEPDPGLVSELSINHERRVLESQRKRAEADPPLFHIRSARAEYLMYVASALFDSGRHEQFLCRAQELLRYFPNHLTVQYRMAQSLLMLSRWREGLDLNRRVIIKRPWMGRALELHGLLAEPLGLYRLAEACYQRSVGIDFCSLVSWRGLFRMHKLKGNLQGMLECIQPLEDLEYADPQYWIDVGAALIEAGRPEEALLVMEKELLKRPEHPICLNNYAFALVKLGRAKEAIPFCEAALRQAPDCPLFLDTQALLLHQLGQREEALGVIERAITIQPDYQTALATKEWIQANTIGAG